MSLLKGTIVLLTIVVGSFALDFSRFLWIGKPTKTTEEAQLIEMVRWRQPVCLMPAEGVSPCSHEIKKFQKQYEQFSGKVVDLETADSSMSTKLKSSLILNDENTDKFESSETIVATPPISEESLKSSETKIIELTENEEEKVRGHRHLSSLTEKKKLQQIYVTKVLNSPMTATLVAYGCLPDIGLPLCQNYQPAAQTTKPVFEFKPSLTVSVAEKPVIDHEKPVKTPSGTFTVNVHQSFNDATNKPTETKPRIIVKDPSNEESSTKFVLEETSTAKATIQVDQTTEDAKPAVINNLPPSKVNFFGQTSVDNQSVKTEVSIELSKDAASDVDTSRTSESKEAPKKNELKILQTIRDFVNKTEHSKIVQSIQNIFRKKAETSSTVDAASGSGKSSNPVEIDDNVQYKDNSTVTKTETASDNACTSDKMAADQKPIVVEDLRKPLMDGFEDPGAKSTEEHGSFGDISKNTGKLAEVDAEKGGEVKSDGF